MEVEDSTLTFEQQTLFDLCAKDLLSSCQRQLLMDLQRMQNLVHRRLSVPGEVEHTVANIFIVSQRQTSVLQNTRNLCYGNAPWRCWRWTGAFADDATQAWGRSQQAVR